jgi:hypothetical protein
MGNLVMTDDAWDNQYDREHLAAWVRALRASGLDAIAIRGEIDRWTLDGVTQICVGAYARTMPFSLARAMVEQALAESVKPT